MGTAEYPIVEFAFPGPLRDALVAAIVEGRKTSTSSLLIEYEVEGEPLPVVGERGRVVDSAGAVVAVIETVGVEVVPLGEIGLQHALDEGEGFTSVEQWRRGHEEFWLSDQYLAALGGHQLTLDDTTLVVVERFRTI